MRIACCAPYPLRPGPVHAPTHKAHLVPPLQVNLTSDGPVLVEPGAKLDFTFTVNWQPTEVTFARRFERYLDFTFFEHKVCV